MSEAEEKVAAERGEQAADAGRPREEQSAEQQAEEVAQELDELGAAKRERDEYLELAQRTRADFENYRKRAAREAEEARTRGGADLAKQLIPALDNLERALQTADADPESFTKGVRMIAAELAAALERNGVEAYDPAGERFDPAWHEALETRAADGGEPGHVVETLEKGYRLDGQVLRPARVVVSE